MAVGLSESATIGILLLLVFGAVSFYLYSRINYTEKRMGLIENMLLDLKLGLESITAEEPHFVPEPVGSPRPMESGESEALPEGEVHTETLPEEETYYQSVLQQAGQEAAADGEAVAAGETAGPGEAKSEKSEKSLGVSVNYESMAKDDLIALAEKRGAKVGKRPGRKDLIAALRKLDGVTGTTSTLFPTPSETETVSEIPGSGFPVDLGAEVLQ